MNRNFKGVWIPKEIWLNKNLSITEKALIVEIDSLDNEKGCFAGNSHFSEFLGIGKTRVSQLIKSLVEKNFVTSKIIYKTNSKQVENRILKIVINRTPPPLENDNTPLGKCKGNNTVNNTIKKEREVKSNPRLDNSKFTESRIEIVEYYINLPKIEFDLVDSYYNHHFDKYGKHFTLDENRKNDHLTKVHIISELINNLPDCMSYRFYVGQYFARFEGHTIFGFLNAPAMILMLVDLNHLSSELVFDADGLMMEAEEVIDLLKEVYN